MAHGISPEEFRSRPYVYTIINTNSPLQLDIPMADGIIDFAVAGQVLIITPFTLAGAMAPVTIAGALTLAHAEGLAGLTLAQIVRPGAPIVYGSFTSNVDMKSGSPAFGTPEYVKAAFGAGQLARFLGLALALLERHGLEHPGCPVRLRIADEPLGRTVRRLQFRAACGGLAGERTDHLVREIHPGHRDAADVRRGVPAGGGGAADIALEAVAEVGPGGHFFGCAHTMERYRSAFYAPLVSDWRNFGSWAEDGGKTATERASAIWQGTLAIMSHQNAIPRWSRPSTRMWQENRRGRRTADHCRLRAVPHTRSCRFRTRGRRDITSPGGSGDLTWRAVNAL